jgi:hypothetical protein
LNINSKFVVSTTGDFTASGAKLTSADISGKVTVTSGSLNINDKFVVDASGNLTANGATLTSASVSGSIIASSGSIGGITIGDKEMYIGDVGTRGMILDIKYSSGAGYDTRLPEYTTYISKGWVNDLSCGLTYNPLYEGQSNWIRFSPDYGFSTFESTDIRAGQVTSSIPSSYVRKIPTFVSSKTYDDANCDVNPAVLNGNGHIAYYYGELYYQNNNISDYKILLTTIFGGSSVELLSSFVIDINDKSFNRCTIDESGYLHVWTLTKQHRYELFISAYVNN